jgi:pimeloyl-ACP methyl ester carboxylesterase
MTKVFVHGNPETTAVWEPLLPALKAQGISDIVLLSPPGFGVPVPDGFAGTRIAYRDWLIAEIEKIGHPVDLLGHDWGAGHTYGVAAARPDLLRSWAADCAGLVHPDYEWHPAAATP